MAESTGLTLAGKIVKVCETVEISDTFSKRELWVEIDSSSQYPQVVAVEFVKDKCTLLNGLKAGQLVSVDVNLRGQVRETKNGERCFTSLNGWRLKVDGVSKSAPAKDSDKLPENNTSGDASGEDDLPF